MRESPRPTLAVTLGDPRGIGPEVARAAAEEAAGSARLLLVGPEELLPEAGHGEPIAVGRWDPSAPDPERLAGRLAGTAVERAVRLATSGEADGVVTAPVSKRAFGAAGYDHPGHTELLRELTGAREVTMMMAAERTPAGGALRMALVTAHVPLREVPGRLTRALVHARARVAAEALRDWWGIASPRLLFAGLNPHASEGGMFGDEEERILVPAGERLAADGIAAFAGVHPADTVFRRCLRGEGDAVVVPYHDVGLAAIKTLALETAVNVTAGLPFPRTSPAHGTAPDIAGTGSADPRSMIEALRLCARLCPAAQPAPG